MYYYAAKSILKLYCASRNFPICGEVFLRLAEILKLPYGILILRYERRRLVNKFEYAPVHYVSTPLHFYKNIGKRAEDRDEHDGYDPRKLVVRVGLVVDYPHQYNDGQGYRRDSEVYETVVEKVQSGNDKENLQRKTDDYNHSTSENYFKKIFQLLFDFTVQSVYSPFILSENYTKVKNYNILYYNGNI